MSEFRWQIRTTDGHYVEGYRSTIEKCYSRLNTFRELLPNLIAAERVVAVDENREYLVGQDLIYELVNSRMDPSKPVPYVEGNITVLTDKESIHNFAMERGCEPPKRTVTLIGGDNLKPGWYKGAVIVDVKEDGRIIMDISKVVEADGS